MLRLASVLFVVLLIGHVKADDVPQRIEVYPASISLTSARGSAQLVVTGYFAVGEVRDLTRTAKFRSNASNIAEVQGTRIVPRGDGQAHIEVTLGSLSANVPVQVSHHSQSDPIRFRSEVLPILTKQGCNAGSCHGAPEGKGGFALSMLAYAPQIDEESLIRGGLGRRTEPIEPEESLLLKKPMLRVTHVGGKRLRKTDIGYRVLRDWIQEGVKPDAESAPTCLKVVVHPSPARVLKLPHGEQQMSVLAQFSDGTLRDVTSIATFDSTNKDVLTVDANGKVAGKSRGFAAVTVRYLSFVESTNFTLEQNVAGFVWNNPVEANEIDKLVHARLRQMQYLPSDPCDDADFIRRVFLDLTGLLPNVARIKSFHEQAAAISAVTNDAVKRDQLRELRAKLIDELLASDEFARFWALRSADLMRVNNNVMKEGRAELFANWLIDSYRKNQPFDQFVRELLTATGDSHEVGPTNYFLALPKQDEVAETTAQLFMGSRITCAKCHNHPFENWTQNDYYRIAAAFARVKLTGDDIEVSASGEAMHPATGAAMQPWGSETASAETIRHNDRREIFASWLTQRGNPFFAKSEVNRMWAHLLGRGIVHPVDDFRSTNPASNPEILNWLAAEFERSGFDRKHIIRLICNSATYQRSATANQWNADDQALFSHYTVRRLTAEQLQDAIGVVMHTLPPVSDLANESRQQQQELAQLQSKLADERPKWEASLREKVVSKNCWQTSWWHVGPFPEPNYETAAAKEYPPEKGIDFAAKLPRRLKWKSHPEWKDGEQYQFTSNAPGVHYVTRKIVTTRAGKAALSFGSDDGLRVWLNGKIILDKPERRGIKKDDDQLTVDLLEGSNTLLLKVIDAGGYTGFYFKLATFDGLPPNMIDVPQDIAELVAIAPERRTAVQQEQLSSLHEAAQPRIKAIRDQLRRLEQRADYHTQRTVPEQSEFLVAFGQPKRETACVCERLGEPTIEQTLQTLNGNLVWSKTLTGSGHYLKLTDEELLNELFLIALSRSPTVTEHGKLLVYLKSKPNRQEAIQDVLWALINLREFLFQH